jgi:hypothetical protein
MYVKKGWMINPTGAWYAWQTTHPNTHTRTPTLCERKGPYVVTSLKVVDASSHCSPAAHTP